MRAPVLEAVGLALPPHRTPQRDVRRTAEEILGTLAPELLPKLDVFETVGIDARSFVRPVAWYLEPHGWHERAAVYSESGTALLVEAARDALARAEVGPDAVDGIVLVSTTGLATPSLDARILAPLGLRPDITRIPVWGLGCAGGVAGLDVAASLARAHPDKRYLCLALETCSLAFDLSDMSVRAFVAATLFGDGAAAALVRGGDLRGIALGRLTGGLTHTWPDSLDVMGWDVADEGLRVVFSRRIPDIVARDFAPLVHRAEKTLGSADRHVFHPGGTKVLEAYERGLGLGPEALASARAVLRAHGNMSSPTVLFVLRDALARAPLAAGERALLAALGPGFTASLAMLEG